MSHEFVQPTPEQESAALALLEIAEYCYKTAQAQRGAVKLALLRVQSVAQRRASALLGPDLGDPAVGMTAGSLRAQIERRVTG